MPQTTPRFAAAGRSPKSYSAEVSSGSHSAASAARTPQRRHGGMGHRDGAAVARLDLRDESEERGACDVRARARLRPGERVQAVPDREPHQLVPGRVELDLVDALAEAVVGAQIGGFSFASRPHSSGSPPSSRPSSEQRSAAQPAPSRASASASGRFSAKRSCPASGGGWLAFVAPPALRGRWPCADDTPGSDSAATPVTGTRSTEGGGCARLRRHGRRRIWCSNDGGCRLVPPSTVRPEPENRVRLRQGFVTSRLCRSLALSGEILACASPAPGELRPRTAA